ncbi:phosphotransferase family protein [Candidatus Lucifugimonas marina]|uniref:Phosphotransferase n=1 Tax=Candidatus Lucifugimonas marina TaxID=3038979 RepID=A0AAJ5ZF02_9CHLR|nr:phosphotransferase [SAR202 cluster bacterium JH702]MDG0869428.1 phosphotransferase [SAR202 cluster bacterium JH639]WFG38100.1 phosphotransferase [SAR202 cluster bacterium JH1073]
MPIPPAPTPSQFEQVARAINPDAKVISTHKLLGGLGCRMDVLEYRVGDGDSQRVVTRQYWVKDDPTSDKRPIGESKILRALQINGVPAPEPVLNEEVASEIFGRPGLVISYINGMPNLGPADLQDWARQIAVALAKIHTSNVPHELELLPQAHVGSLKKWMNAEKPPERFEKHELGSDLWSAMRTLWPSVDTSARQIIHTDFWPGNMLWKADQLLAIVDWEWPSLGVPSGDVGYFLSDAAYVGFDVEKTFLETYESVSGKPVQDLLFWKMLATAMPLPDVGPWAQGYAELGMRKMNADEIRRAHRDHIANLIEEFNQNA